MGAYLIMEELITDNDFLLSLGRRIKKGRLKRNLTQLQLAVLCDIEKGHLSRIERGKTNPTIATLQTIAGKLEMNFVELFQNGN